MEKKKKSENRGNLFLIILFLIIAILVLMFPKIYKYFQYLSLPKINYTDKKNTNVTKEVDNETLESIHYPLMRSSVFDSNTYYNLNEFTFKDMSNSDILLNAYLDIYEGNITSYEGIGTCTNESKQFNEDYIKLRIKNILGKNVNYTLEDFYVPEDSNSSYTGYWSYDSLNYRFIYNGLCTSKQSNTKYYNLEQYIKAEYDNDNLIVYYYVGFANVIDNNYTIYSDPDMKNILQTGTFTTLEELQNIFNNINNKDKKIYKYTFRDDLCSYNEYCLYKGEWINEL